MNTPAVIPPRWSTHTLVVELVDHPLRAHADARGVVIEHRTAGGPAFLGAGDPHAVAGHLRPLAGAGFVRGMMPRGTWELLAPATRAAFNLPHAEEWDWMEIDHVPAHPGAHRVREMDPRRDAADLARVKEAAIPDSFLSLASPGVRWFGWADEAGIVRAIGGAMGWDGHRWRTGAHFGSIGTEPGWRGRGIGTALTAGMTALAFAEGARSVSLGVYTHNTGAICLYTRLGFRTVHRIHSRKRR